jgi:nucleotide-binding universal stress UspA family protein
VELELRTVVVATNFSELGDAALRTGFRLAADHGARVVLVHVVEPVQLPNPLYAHYQPTPTPEQRRNAAAAAGEALRERVPAAYRARVAHEALVVERDPADEILRVASESGASLVVLGSRGRRGVERLRLGSVTGRVATRAPCPVLIVR